MIVLFGGSEAKDLNLNAKEETFALSYELIINQQTQQNHRAMVIYCAASIIEASKQNCA